VNQVIRISVGRISDHQGIRNAAPVGALWWRGEVGLILGVWGLEFCFGFRASDLEFARRRWAGAPRRTRTPRLSISGGVPSPLPTLAHRVARDSLLSPLPRRGGTPSPTPPLGWGAGNRVDAGEQKDLVREVVRPGGLEPPAFWSVARRSIQLSYGRTVYGSANGNRTRVSTLRGWCPRPLDDGAP
jgi:hypothetical protein